jgi:hypothetical protein
MEISEDFSRMMIDTASGIKSEQVMSEISMAILKQIQDQQERQAAMLVKMINQTPIPSLDGTGQIIDIYA